MYQIFLFIQCISIVILTIESIYVFVNWQTKGQSYLLAFCVAAAINNVGYLLIMSAKTSGEALIANKICYFGKVWIPIAFLAMIFEMCEIRISKKVQVIFSTIHALVFLLVLTCDRHNLFYNANRKFVTSGLFPHNEFGHAFFYNAYMVLVFWYIIAGIIILIRRFVNERESGLRKLYIHLITAVLVMAFGLLAYMFKITKGYDSTSLGYAITAVVMLITIFKYNFLDTLSVVKDYAIDTIPEGVIATDRKDKIVYYNKAAKEIYKDLDIAPVTTIESIKKHIEEKSVANIRDRIYEPIANPFYKDKMERGTLYVLNDVTVRYRHMEELREQKEIAENANASKTAFLSVVTHEIRTPMTSIVGMTELILRDEASLSKKQVNYLKNIKNSGDALVMIVNDILDQSKIESGKMEIIDEVYDIRSLIEIVKMIIDNRIGSKSIHLMFEVDDEVPPLLIGDSLRIRQIMINLMNNAVKFTEEGYIKLSIKVVEEEEKRKLLKFSIKDSGQGIKPEDLDKLGQAFLQVDSKRNHQKEGTGLGLSISKDFIALMGGKLEVKSEYGKGSEFFFSIWQGVPESSENGQELPGANPANSEAYSQRSIMYQNEMFTAPDAKILVVDDIELNRLIVEELLSPFELQIDMASSGESAIELIKKNRYNVVFMDYMMPYMDGIEATGIIRQLSKDETFDSDSRDYFKSVPIIALSGDDSDDTKESFQIAGIDDFTVKPVELKKLKGLLLKWLPKEMIKG